MASRVAEKPANGKATQANSACGWLPLNLGEAHVALFHCQAFAAW